MKATPPLRTTPPAALVRQGLTVAILGCVALLAVGCNAPGPRFEAAPTGPSPAAVVSPVDADALAALRAQWAESLGLPVRQSIDLGDGLWLDLVLVPPGKFTIGEEDVFEAQPRRLITIRRAFYLGTCEVTNAQYRRFRREHHSGTFEEHDLDGPQLPVVHVSWDDAQAFCEWLSERVGAQVRLPSEAEWEYVARGGDGRSYPWGPEQSPDVRHANLLSYGGGGDLFDFLVNHDDPFEGPAPVGSFPANPFGVHDLDGNVMEWCADVFHLDFEDAPSDETPRGGPMDPDLRVELRESLRSLVTDELDPTMSELSEEFEFDDDDAFYVVRGLAWKAPLLGNWTAGFRGPMPASVRMLVLGFRVAVTIPAPDSHVVGP